MTEFPVLDAPRPIADREYNRIIVDSFGHAEPYIEETDGWVALPLRLVHNQAAGWCVEIGPYSLDRRDIAALQAAIRAYHEAVDGPNMRIIEGHNR